jgi:hypothetical protein
MHFVCGSLFATIGNLGQGYSKKQGNQKKGEQRRDTAIDIIFYTL